MTKNVVARYKGARALQPHFPKSMRRYLGYSLEVDGDDLVVYDNDPALRSRPPVVTCGKARAVAPANFAAIAADYKGFLNASLEARMPASPPRDHAYPNNLGTLSALHRARFVGFWSRGGNLERDIVSVVLPSMAEIGARRAIPFHVDVELFQFAISAAKIGHLGQSVGMAEASKLILEERVLEPFLPLASEVSGYLDALMFLDPTAFALPLHRPGSGIYFTADPAWAFLHPFRCNVFETAASSFQPMNEVESELIHVKDFSIQDAKNFVRLAVVAMNRLFAWMTAPTSMRSDGGELDHWKFLKAVTAIRLLFADLLAINYTASAYAKSRLAFMFLDKLSNLALNLADWASTTGSKRPTETQGFNFLLSHEAFKATRAVFRDQKPLVGEGTSKWLIRTTHRIEKAIEDSKDAVFVGIDTSEASRLRASYIRTLRNMAHGTFLERDRVESLFLKVNATVPAEIAYVPWFLMLALCLSPAHFLAEVTRGMSKFASKPGSTASRRNTSSTT